MVALDAREGFVPKIVAVVGQPSPRDGSGLLVGANREQRRAIAHGAGPALVVAGPGTGKTEVITRRVAWLIATRHALPREILALTFTDNAAQEMQARVDVLVSWNFKHMVNLRRIHGYNSVNLRRGYPTLEIRAPREVLSDE